MDVRTIERPIHILLSFCCLGIPSSTFLPRRLLFIHVSLVLCDFTCRTNYLPVCVPSEFYDAPSSTCDTAVLLSISVSFSLAVLWVWVAGNSHIHFYISKAYHRYWDLIGVQDIVIELIDNKVCLIRMIYVKFK